MSHDRLTDAFDAESMGASTERGNVRLGIGRTTQNGVAAASHQRAAAATDSGILCGKIVAGHGHTA